MKRLLACGIVFFVLAWTAEKVQASGVSTDLGVKLSLSQVQASIFLAQDPAGGESSETPTKGGGSGMQKIKQALYSGGGGGGEGGSDGILDIGLSWLRSIILFFLGLYGVYLGVAMAFGQADGSLLISFFVGSMMALGAQAVSGFYTALFGGDGAAGGGSSGGGGGQ